jgi:spermidine/putrescine transport system ATP-binding protein
MQDELKAIQKRVGTAFVHVTHDQEEAMALADLIVVMNEGRIEDLGTPERVYERPATRFTATFMGESTIVKGEVRSGKIHTVIGIIDGNGLGDGARVHVALRPEHFHQLAGAGGVALRVDEVVFQGSFKRVLGALADASDVKVVAKLPVASSASAGQTIRLGYDAAQAIVLSD